jgi:hypothetical protein
MVRVNWKKKKQFVIIPKLGLQLCVKLWTTQAALHFCRLRKHTFCSPVSFLSKFSLRIICTKFSDCSKLRKIQHRQFFFVNLHLSPKARFALMVPSVDSDYGQGWTVYDLGFTRWYQDSVLGHDSEQLGRITRLPLWWCPQWMVVCGQCAMGCLRTRLWTTGSNFPSK